MVNSQGQSRLQNVQITEEVKDKYGNIKEKGETTEKMHTCKTKIGHLHTSWNANGLVPITHCTCLHLYRFDSSE